MEDMWALMFWICAIVVAYLMAEKQGRDVRWAVVGGLLFGWFCPLYYLITKNSYLQKKQMEELLKINKELAERERSKGQ